MPRDVSLPPAARSALGSRIGVKPTPAPAPRTSSIFPLGSQEAIFKEEQRLFNKIGASKVLGFQDDVRQRYGDHRRRNNDELAGPYLSRLARTLETDHKLDTKSAFRAAERIIKDALA